MLNLFIKLESLAQQSESLILQDLVHLSVCGRDVVVERVLISHDREVHDIGYILQCRGELFPSVDKGVGLCIPLPVHMSEEVGLCTDNLLLSLEHGVQNFAFLKVANWF